MDQVRPRGDLRHHPAVGRVLALLAQQHLGQYFAVTVQYGGGGFVAGALDAQDGLHPSLSFRRRCLVAAGRCSGVDAVIGQPHDPCH